MGFYIHTINKGPYGPSISAADLAVCITLFCIGIFFTKRVNELLQLEVKYLKLSSLEFLKIGLRFATVYIKIFTLRERYLVQLR